MENIAIIPQPQSMIVLDGEFMLDASTNIVASDETRAIAEFLQALLSQAIGYDFPIVASGETGIIIRLIDNSPSEAYGLKVSEQAVLIEAASPRGLFWGLQTFRQLLPSAIESLEIVENQQWVIPCVKIDDAPRFAWRGLHLDVARHFFDVAFIKKFIDLMVLYKFNVFHWHLTEDQGWRIEIEQYPKLTEIGSQRKSTPIPADRNQSDGKPYGGYYTKDDIREIVDYATARHITVIPEIEMPGHAMAALASYPELGCLEMDYEVWTRWGISEEAFCAGKEATFTFLENVLSEVLALFPSEYIHIGGDECLKTRWEVCPDCQARIQEENLADEHELQSYFIRRIEQWLNARGRRLVGWDEIMEGGLSPNATVMSWRGSQGGIDAANLGHDAVMSPTTHCYFDYYQSKNADEPPAIGNYLPLERVYEYQPIPTDIDDDKIHHILGGQGNIWTEYLPTSELVEYMAYPRAIALAEILWSYPQNRDFANFKMRLRDHTKRLDRMNVNYRSLDDDA